MKLNKKGFTMMELLVVTLIIASIAAIVYPSYRSTIERARASEAVNMLSAIQAAQAKHFVNYESYATTFKDIRDFSPAIDNFDINSTSFASEYFQYTMHASSATAIRKNSAGENVAAGYALSAGYEDRFIECIAGDENGDNVCSSLTDHAKEGNKYRIY